MRSNVKVVHLIMETVAQELATGVTKQSIAHRLGVSEATIRNAARLAKVVVPAAVRLEARFWEKADKENGPVHPIHGRCWVWASRKTRHGYGTLSVGGRDSKRHPYAHRMAWEFTNGSIAAGLCVCHKCDNPPCVRPDHLFLGTDADNTADRVAKGRTHSRLNASDVSEIRRLAASGVPRKELVTRFATSRTNVDSIINRRLWRHLHGDATGAAAAPIVSLQPATPYAESGGSGDETGDTARTAWGSAAPSDLAADAGAVDVPEASGKRTADAAEANATDEVTHALANAAPRAAGPAHNRAPAAPKRLTIILPDGSVLA